MKVDVEVRVVEVEVDGIVVVVVEVDVVVRVVEVPGVTNQLSENMFTIMLPPETELNPIQVYVIVSEVT